MRQYNEAGGGPTGVEFCANLHDFVRTDAARHYPQLAPLVRVKLYDVAPHILSSFDSTIVAYAERTLRRENVDIHTGHHIECVEQVRAWILFSEAPV